MFEDKIEELLNSIHDTGCDTIENVIIKSNISLISEAYLKRLNEAYAMRIKVLQLKQKYKYNVFCLAINEFLTECNKYNLKPVFMKGIFLAADLYDKIEKRLSHDIDLLIKLEEFKMYYRILKQLGYLYGHDCEDGLGEYESNYKELQKQHLVYVKDINQTKVCIEIHIAIINTATLFQNASDEFINTAIQKEYLGLKPYVLDIEHNLIQLAVHFYKHLTLSYFQNMLFKREHSVNLNNLHDIALFQHKYKNEIDVNKVLDISKRMKIVKYILLVFKLVNSVYGELFSTYFFDLLSANVDCSKIDCRGSERSGFGKLVWLLDIYVDYCKDISMKQFVLGDMPDKFRLINIAISDQSKLFHIKKGEEIEFKENFVFPIVENNKSHTVNSHMDLLITSREIVLKYSIYNKKCCSYQNKEDACYTRDSIEIIVIKDQSIIHRMFTVSNINNRFSMVVYSNNTEEIIDIGLTKLNYFLDIQKNGFSIHLVIPWSFLNINPDMDRIVPFNIAGLVSNPETLMQDKACTIFNKDEFIWNFQGINGIVFE